MQPRPIPIDELPWRDCEEGGDRFERARVTEATPATALACSGYRIPPGTRTRPVHYHTANEEAVYVLEGEGTMSLGPDREAFSLAPDTYVALPAGPAGTHEILAGDAELSVLVFSTMREPEITVFPPQEEALLSAGGAPGTPPADTQFRKTVDLEPPAVDRERLPEPASQVVRSESVPWSEYDHGERSFRRRHLAGAAGGERIGCSSYDVPAGSRTWLRHWHGGNEEALYALSGSGTVRLGPEATEHPFQAGDYVALPADERGTHEVVAGGDGLRYLAVSEMNEPDVTAYTDREMVGLYVGAPPGGDSGQRSISTYLDLNAEREYWEE